jgi:hypothetical protein
MLQENGRTTRSGVRREQRELPENEFNEQQAEETEELDDECAEADHEEDRMSQVGALEAQLEALRKAQEGLARQLQTQTTKRAPDNTMEQLAGALSRLVPRVEVPNNPGPYEGGQDFPKWRRYLLRCAQANRWTQEELVERLPQYLDGPAWSTFESLRARGLLADDIEEVLDQIGTAHCDMQGAKRDAELRFKARKQRGGESIPQFLSIFESLATDCGASDKKKREVFVENVVPDIAGVLMRRQAKTWTEMRDAAVLEQQIIDSQKSRRVTQVAHLYQGSYQEELDAHTAAVQAVQDRQTANWHHQRGGMPPGWSQDARADGVRGGPQQPPDDRDKWEARFDALTRLVEQLARTQAQPRVSASSNQGRGAGQGGQDSGWADRRRCYQCGGIGHLARQCPRSGNGADARVMDPAQASKTL